MMNLSQLTMLLPRHPHADFISKLIGLEGFAWSCGRAADMFTGWPDREKMERETRALLCMGLGNGGHNSETSIIDVGDGILMSRDNCSDAGECFLHLIGDSGENDVTISFNCRDSFREAYSYLRYVRHQCSSSFLR